MTVQDFIFFIFGVYVLVGICIAVRNTEWVRERAHPVYALLVVLIAWPALYD